MDMAGMSEYGFLSVSTMGFMLAPITVGIMAIVSAS